MTDIFNNSSNDYVIPTVSPCPGVGDDQILVWTKDGLTIIKGSQEIANIDFSDLAIPINAFNKQQILLQEGEVTFIQGLDKGLCLRQQGFELPNLISSDLDLNPYFMQIDLSISYYRNFGFVHSNIDISANYGQTIDIADALNLDFDSKGIKVTSSYDPSVLTFTGSQEGYDFTISNVSLTILDTSVNASSPFENGDNAETYDLLEDASYNILYAKYPNTAMQGIVLRVFYPDQNEDDMWVYLHHVSDYANIYSETSINYDVDISSNLIIDFDSSTFISPTITFTPDPSYVDVSIYSQILVDISANGCVFEDCSIFNSLFYNTQFIKSIVSDSSIDSSTANSIINDDSSVLNSTIISAWVNTYRLLVYTDPSTLQKTYEYVFDDDIVTAYGRVNIYESLIWDSSINNALLYDCSIYNSYIKDSSVNGCTLYNSVYDSSTTLNNSVDFLVDASIGCQYDINYDSSIFYSKSRKRIEVGMSGCSLGESISAGDYLNWITINNRWKKVGETYIWSSSIDSGDCTIKNLIDGFYVFNPHDFTVRIEYMIFV